MTSEGNTPSFATIHSLPCRKRGVLKSICQLNGAEELDDHWRQRTGNEIIFLQGYPSPEWISRLGDKLNVDYEFLYQHFANSSQLYVGENYCLPPLSIVGTDTIQITFTSIGSWDNHQSRIDLSTARRELDHEMRKYLEDLNKGKGIQPCDSVVRSFYLHDLKHFSIRQQVSITLIQEENSWIRKYAQFRHKIDEN